MLWEYTPELSSPQLHQSLGAGFSRLFRTDFTEVKTLRKVVLSASFHVNEMCVFYHK